MHQKQYQKKQAEMALKSGERRKMASGKSESES